MFIRSKDGKHLTEAKSIDLADNRILVDGTVYAEYDSPEQAEVVFKALCTECCSMETFFDLKGEIRDEEYDDDDVDDDDDDDDDDDSDSGNNGRFRIIF